MTGQYSQPFDHPKKHTQWSRGIHGFQQPNRLPLFVQHIACSYLCLSDTRAERWASGAPGSGGEVRGGAGSRGVHAVVRLERPHPSLLTPLVVLPLMPGSTTPLRSLAHTYWITSSAWKRS